MNESIRAFLRGIIDYAGLFPPASLPLEKAFENYLQYMDSNHAWMLSSFVIPATRLPQLDALTEKITSQHTVPLSLLGKQNERLDEFMESFSSGIAYTKELHEKHSGKFTTAKMELKVPTEVSASGKKRSLKEMLIEIREILSANEKLPRAIFLEVPFDENWKDSSRRLIEVLADDNVLYGSSSLDLHLAYKLRTGGVEAWMVPSTDQVRWALTTARKLGVGMKFTAGLHHPVRNMDPHANTMVFGFMNVFIAGLMAYVHDINEEFMTKILEEEDAAAFNFSDEGIAYRDMPIIPREDILQLRRAALCSFGSCSFSEPIEDLESLNLI